MTMAEELTTRIAKSCLIVVAAFVVLFANRTFVTRLKKSRQHCNPTIYWLSRLLGLNGLIGGGVIFGTLLGNTIAGK